MNERFRDRSEAGKKLAEKLIRYQDKDVVVYAIPRGGVVLAVEVAKALHAPLDLVIVRKVGHPYNEEYALCVISESKERICVEEDLKTVDPKWLEKEIDKEANEARRRRETYLAGREAVEVKGKTVILVDDGVATGLTFRMALKELRKRQPAELVAALPVAPRDTATQIMNEADETVILIIPEFYWGAVGAYYDSFPQVADEEVIRYLKGNG